jgi:predicted nucleic acid-binding protein
MTSVPKLRLYIDTNIFLDHFLRRRGKSSTLLREIAKGRFSGVTSQFTMSELTGVLKEARVAINEINRITGLVQSFPNIQIVFHDPNMLQEMPQDMLGTCVQCRDALHFVMAKSLAADRIVTRDEGFKRAVHSIIPCITPEQLLP